MSDELMHQVQEFIINTLRIEGMSPLDIDPDAPLFGDGLGLDSVDALPLVVGLEDRFGVVVPDAAVGARVLRSVRTMADYIEQQSY
jgi:acyl carrier protein